MKQAAGFPLNGYATVTPYSDQEQGTSADLENVVPFDSQGHMRGGIRPGLAKHCTAQVSGSNAIQGLGTISATYVAPVIGDGTVALSVAGVLNARRVSDGAAAASGSPRTYLISCWGPDGKLYAIEYNGTTLYLRRYTYSSTTPTLTNDYEVQVGTSSAAVAIEYAAGMCVDEDTVYFWYRKFSNIGDSIIRLACSNGWNRDSVQATGTFSTQGCWLRAEADATHIEKVFGGVDYAGWTVIPATAHNCMKVFGGKLAVFGCPLKSGGAAGESELVVYIVDTKTGIIDAVVDLNLDGTAASANKGVAWEIEFALDGYVYALFQDSGGAPATYFLRKIDTVGNSIWEISLGTNAARSIAWNSYSNTLAIAGTNVLGTGSSLIAIEPESKGVVEMAKGAGTSPNTVATWDLVRFDLSGNAYLFATAAAVVRKYGVDWNANNVWSQAMAVANDRASVNTYWNPGTDEKGSVRCQAVIGISNGDVELISAGASTAITGGAGALSTSTRTIFTASYGTLLFFADGVNKKYYDANLNQVIDWSTSLLYGALPSGSGGGFSYVEVWNRRVMVFGLDTDPTNFYFSAKGDPFDWDLKPGTANAACSGRLSPTGLFPDKLLAAIPFNDDLMLLGGDHIIMQLTGDPAVDAQLDVVSSTIGMAPGRAWCLDGYGNAFFFGNNGGMFKVGLNAPPQRISNQTIDKQLVADVDVANSSIFMEWDSLRQGIWLFIRPYGGTTSRHYFFDLRTNAYFPIRFASVNHSPLCTASYDLDQPQDRKILLGCADGYIRTLSDSAYTDDGTAFDAYYVVGPWVPSEPGRRLTMDLIQASIGANSEVVVTPQGANTPEECITNPTYFQSFRGSSSETRVWRPNASAHCMAIKVEPAFTGTGISTEGIIINMREMSRGYQ